MGDSLFVRGDQFKPQMGRIFYRTIAPDSAFHFSKSITRFFA
jgi:hypothetical protein